MSKAPFEKKDLVAAEKLLKEGKVKPPLFSEGTYQIEVVEGKQSYWPFIQMDDSGHISDAFCSCGAEEKNPSCPHLAAAYLKIYQGHPTPLHVRFRESLWNQLCQMASRRHGYDTECLQKKGDYRAVSPTGKLLFSMRPLNPQGKKKVQEFIEKRSVETEETSLKFSNLSPEELELWRKGSPSHQLQYELSFWSDLAKWWMILQEEGELYKIEFSPMGVELPKWIKVHFPQVDFDFYISQANWSPIIPSLATVESLLFVYELAHKSIQKITYDPEKKEFLLDFKEEPKTVSASEEKGIELEGWIYSPGKGFFPSKKDFFFQDSVIPTSKVAASLQKHTNLFHKYLTDEKIHEGRYKVQYTLSFDTNRDLHISAYLFEPGDLQKPKSFYFGSWIYVEDRGFFELENPLFAEADTVIGHDKVSDFINRHRTWLNAFEGFQTHLMNIESELHYTVDDKLRLCFESHFSLIEEKGDVIDFEDWVYISDKGFFPKQVEKTGSPLKSGLKVNKEEIPAFIRKHREELKTLPSFFAAQCPVESVQLDVALMPEDRIRVRPSFTFVGRYDSSHVFFFGEFTYVDHEGFSEIPYQRPLLDNYLEEKILDRREEGFFFSHELDTLRPYIRLLDPRLKKPQQLFLRISEVKKEERAKEGGWVIDLDYETELGRVDAVEIWTALQENKKHLFTSAGLISLKQPRFNWLKTISKKKWLKQGKQLRLSSLEWIRLNAFEELKEPSGSGPKEQKSREALEEFRQMQTEQPLNIEGLKSDLRLYQETGLKWLWFLYCNGLSGLLCDEMGLGKTHQAMALLAAAMNGTEEKQKYLVVCPTSVIYHWEDLLHRFLPKIKVYVFYGQGRHLESFHENYDLLLTSYGTLRSEKAQLAKINFDIAIFDEIQNAKNSHSQTNKSLRAIKSNIVIGLTGTPLENRLLELKALFDVVLPTYLPPEAQFKEFFSYPIEKYQDAEKKALLARIIKPFILRRKKSEVLLELPEKIEEIAYCDLSNEQKQLYREVFYSQKDSLVKELNEPGAGKGFVHIFSVLSKLKQICNHPAMITKDYENFQQHHSGKWDLFVELLQEARESNQKIVVFSQYLDMIDMIERYLTQHNIGFAEIRGSTRDRREPLERFKNDPKCEVFVASLQAAGVGIDLTSASVVIHYDRWWNPAKENQATDRVHRIGQNRGVQVFKLVTKKSIEERIHELIEKKMKLFDSVIGFDEHDQIKGLNKQEMLELLRILEKDLQEK